MRDPLREEIEQALLRLTGAQHGDPFERCARALLGQQFTVEPAPGGSDGGYDGVIVMADGLAWRRSWRRHAFVEKSTMSPPGNGCLKSPPVLSKI